MPRGVPSQPLILSEADREQLQWIAQSESLPPALIKRARVLLVCSEEWSNVAVAERTGASQLFVAKWRKSYLEHGIAGLNNNCGAGGPHETPVLSVEERAELLSLAESEILSARTAMRARIVLTCATGLSNQNAAIYLGIDDRSVHKWRQCYLRQGISCIVEAHDGKLFKQPVLSSTDRNNLLQIAQSESQSAYAIARARIVLACAEGSSDQAVAERLGLSENVVWRCRRRYLKHGVAGFESPSSAKSRGPVILSEADRVHLQQITQSDSRPLATVMYARILLACAEGLSDRAVAERLGVDEKAVRRWRKRYLKHGAAGFGMLPSEKSRAPLNLSVAEQEQLLEIALSKNQPLTLTLRANIVLACAEGWSDWVIGELLGVDGRSVGKWRCRYLESGVAGLMDLPRGQRPEPMKMSEADRNELQQITQSNRQPDYLVRRARLLLACTENLSNRAIAEQQGVAYATVHKWRHRYLEHGLAGTVRRHRGRTPIYNDDRMARLLQRIRTELPPNGRRWTLQNLADTEGVSMSTLANSLKRYSIDLRALQRAPTDNNDASSLPALRMPRAGVQYHSPKH